MLSTKVGLLSPSSLGGGNYSLVLHFQDVSRAKYVSIGDYLKDSVNNIYEVVTWSTYPSNFASGGSMTVHYVTSDVSPRADTGYNSTFYTPNQVDVRPLMRTYGQIGSISLYSGKDYEYQISAVWTDLSEANKAVVGDRLVDSNGKEFVITYLAVDKFSSPFRVSEVDKEGEYPLSGISSLYHPTSNYDFYQGTELTDPARTNIFNRDKFDIDLLIKEAMSSGGSGGEDPVFSYTNNSGVTILKGRNVRKSGATTIAYANWDDFDTAAPLGVALEDIPDGFSGDVQVGGIVPSGIITSSCFTEGSLPVDGSKHWIFLGSTDGKHSVSPPEENTGKAQNILGVWDNGKLILRIGTWGVS